MTFTDLMGVTTRFWLNSRPGPQKELMPGFVYMTKTSIVREAIASREPFNFFLLNAHILKLPSKYIFIPIDYCCSQPGLRKFLLAVGNSYCRDSWMVKEPRVSGC